MWCGKLIWSVIEEFFFCLSSSPHPQLVYGNISIIQNDITLFTYKVTFQSQVWVSWQSEWLQESGFESTQDHFLNVIPLFIILSTLYLS